MTEDVFMMGYVTLCLMTFNLFRIEFFFRWGNMFILKHSQHILYVHVCTTYWSDGNIERNFFVVNLVMGVLLCRLKA